MTGLPAPVDPPEDRQPEPSGAHSAPADRLRRPRLRLERGAATDATPLIDLGTGAVLRTIVTAARRHASEAGSSSEIRDLTKALENAVALLVPELRQALLKSLHDNFGLDGVGEGTAGHVWRPTNYGALCESCLFSVASSEPRLMQALAETPCTCKYEDTAELLRRR
jgi:hypothetical protein